MRSSTVLPLLLASAFALPEIYLKKRERPSNAQLKRRAGGTLETNPFDVLSWSPGGAYYVNITVGTPPQQQTVILDTGSSDLYFDASTAETCQLPPDNPNSCQGGTFNPKDSSTYQEVVASPAFNTSFGDGSTAAGAFGTDVIGIGDVLVSPVQFGVATDTISSVGYTIGLMGVGYSAGEANSSAVYPNVPDMLVGAGVINSRVYSVYLNDQRAISGSILFGGIDRSKYTGDLGTMDFLPTSEGGQVQNYIDRLIAPLTAFNVTANGNTSVVWAGGSTNASIYEPAAPGAAVLLDSGATDYSIPPEFFKSYIEPAFPFVENGQCSCKYASEDYSLSLEFGGTVTITVNANEFIVPAVDPKTRTTMVTSDGEQVCRFLLSASTDKDSQYYVLGQAALRSMYVVYDLDNAQVSIAQAKVNNTDAPDIVTVQAGPTGIAAAVGSNVRTAASNTWSIPAAATALASFTVSTAGSAVGTATGSNAIPLNAQITGSASATVSLADSTATSSKGAASGLGVGAETTGFWIASLWVALAGLGAALTM